MQHWGRFWVGISGPVLEALDVRLIKHPAVSGVVLFSRNIVSAPQLQHLTAALRDLRSDLIIALDHEGGRVQRYAGHGLTPLPQVAHYGAHYLQSPEGARKAAFEHGHTTAQELSALGIDLAFAPVLDVDHGHSRVMRDRCFSNDPETVADLASAFISGLHQGGMQAVGKHFPGHGYAALDSHLELPCDDRGYPALEYDVQPYVALKNQLAGIMTAHIRYPAVDDTHVATCSPLWIRHHLRERLGFQGWIFSDDLHMQALDCYGNLQQRARSAVQAGCDLLLLCQNPLEVFRVLCEEGDSSILFGEGPRPALRAQRRMLP